MEITQNFVNLWWWLQSADEQALLTAITLIVTSTAFSWFIQHIKRKTGIDMLNKGKSVILALLAVLSTIGSLADYYIISPDNFTGHFFGYGTAIFTLATIIHRVHVSPMYDKLTNVLSKFAQDVREVRAAKYSKPVAPTTATPAEQPASFEG